MKVSIVIVTYNSENHIYECLRSIQQHTKGDIEVVVVDNSGKNYGLDFVTVNQSGSYPSGLNQGIALSKGDVIVCCNPDIRMTAGWLPAMLDTLLKGNAIVGPYSDFVSGAQNTPLTSQMEFVRVKFLIGFCFAMHRFTYDRIGTFDEQFEFEQDDLDYSLRARKKGFGLAIAPAFIHHVGHQSMDASSPDKRYLSLYRMLTKYKDLNVAQYLGASWPADWLDEVARRYPEVKDYVSFNTAK